MKKYTSLFLLALFFSSCSNSKEENDSSENIVSSTGTVINIVNKKWLTKKTNQFGEVHLLLEGNTNADSLKIRNSGDGLIYWNKIDLDANKKFKTNLYISFTAANPLPTKSFQSTTIVRAYKGADIFEFTLTSGNLMY